MPRVEFSEENKLGPSTNFDFPKLKLKAGERARIMAGLESPVLEYVHTLRAPVVENGRPVLVPVERKDKSIGQEYKQNFVSRPLCLGDPGIIADKGSDPKNCPICKHAQQHPDQVQAPQPRYAMHVLRYKTKSGTWDIQNPFQVELLVWSFTSKVFNRIADIKKEFESLLQHDLTLGPCVNENFQQFDISVGSKAEWLQDTERKAIVKTIFAENQIPDLSIAAGSRKELRWIEDDLARISEAWSIINGAQGPATSLEEDLESLSAGFAPVADEKPSTDEDILGNEDLGGLDEFLKSDAEEAPAPKSRAKAKAAPAEEPAAAASEDVDDFEDLLAGL